MNVRQAMVFQHKLLRLFASKMQAGSTKNTKDNAGRRLGIKKAGSNEVQPGDILARQRGFRWHPGNNTYIGKDHTIHSLVEGYVEFERSQRSWKLKKKKYIMHVIPKENANKVRRPAPYCYHPELFPERAINNPEPYNFSWRSRPMRQKPESSILGKGTRVESPKNQMLLSLSADMIPRKRKFGTMNEQILERVNSKINLYCENTIDVQSTTV